MSHFTVLVIGENPEEQLAPFNENLRTEFKDQTEEFREEYETKMVDEFYCNSSSSWGFKITKELFEILKKSKPGRLIPYSVQKLDPMAYLKSHGKYRGYYTLEDGKRSKGSQWFEVEEITETTHPNPDTCFEGKVVIRKISAPKKIALKDKYINYDEYLKSWHGLDNINEQGYHYNPKAKWDWYQLGGRWAGFFKLKPKAEGVAGRGSLVCGNHAEYGTADQAYKKDIDFDGMLQDRFEESSKNYDEFEEKYKKGEIDATHGYFDYGVHNTGKDADHYVPETREQYLKRHATLSTFAVLKNGEWYERGEMGWWGIVHNEKGVDNWNEEFTKLFKELPDETLLSVFDCHI